MHAQPTPDYRRSWLLLGMLWGYIGVYLGRENQAVAVPLQREEFGASKEEIGRIASAGALAVFVVAARGGGVVAAPACSRSCKRNGFRNSGEGGGGNQLGRVHELVRLRGFRVVSALSFSLTRVRETFNDWTVDFIRTEGGAHLSTSVAAFLATPFDFCGQEEFYLSGR